jgi:hypothetical protein
MNREHASKGYKIIADTTATAFNFYGFTVISEAVVNAIIAPTAGNPEGAYNGDESGLATQTLPVGYYPIRGSNMDLTSGKVILWKE